MAPGFWRCDSLVTDSWYEMRPVPGAPMGPSAMMPVLFSRQRVCEDEYYDATGRGDEEMQFCAICDSNGAIGRCAKDRRMVCGYHSKMHDDVRLCNECLEQLAVVKAQEEADAKEAQVRAAEAEAYAEARAQLSELGPHLDKVRAICASLPDVRDSIDQALVLILLAHSAARVIVRYSSHKYSSDRNAAVHALVNSEVRRILSSTAKALLDEQITPLWDLASDDPTSWSVDWAALMNYWQHAEKLRLGSHLRLVSYEEGRLRTRKRVKEGRIRAWMIASGTASTPMMYGGGGDPGSPPTYLLADGTCASTSNHEISIDESRPSMSIMTLGPFFGIEKRARPILPNRTAVLLEEVTEAGWYRPRAFSRRRRL
jgi:hypothetical protein